MLKLLASATEPEHRSAAENRWQWLLALLFFCVAFGLYTRHSSFPFYYHPDEPTKVAQIRDGTRNFNHPLLLLNTVDLVRSLTGGSKDCQRIAEIGRTCSAFFAALAVALFSWLGFNRFGVIGGSVAGITLLLQRRIYEHAHFMKEDAALLAGIALTLVAIEAFWHRPAEARALLLGAAAAVAASAKYIGIALVPLGVAAIAARRTPAAVRWKSGLAFAAGLLVILALVNHHALISPARVVAGFAGEISRLNTRAGMQWSFSPLYWLRTFIDLSPLLLLGFILHLRFAARSFRRLAPPELLITALPFVFGFILSFSSKQSGRHTLPILVAAAFLGSMAAIRESKRLHARGVRAAGRWITLLVVMAVAYDLVRTAIFDRSFARDHRRELAEWITANLPREAIIGMDDRVGIPFGQSERFCGLAAPIPQQVRGAQFAADLGTLEEMRASGVTHVATSESRYYIVTNGQASSPPPDDGKLSRRRAFYQRLFSEGRLVWSRETGNVGVLNPSLRLYEIAPPASARVP